MKIYIDRFSFRSHARIKHTPIKYCRYGNLWLVHITPYYQLPADETVVGVIFTHSELRGIKYGITAEAEMPYNVEAIADAATPFRSLFTKSFGLNVSIESRAQWGLCPWIRLTERDITRLCRRNLLSTRVNEQLNTEAARI
jgi:hypothetical protein